MFRKRQRVLTTTRKSVNDQTAHTSINQIAKTGNLDNLSTKIIKKMFFPRTAIYQNPHYPMYMSWSDYAWPPGNTQCDAYFNHDTGVSVDGVTQKFPLGVLLAKHGDADKKSYGRQVLVQFPILSQQEFCQLHVKSQNDNELPFGETNVTGFDTLNVTSLNPEDQASPWFRYRSLFLETYEATFKFTNSSNNTVNVELITWQPKMDIKESTQVPLAEYETAGPGPSSNANNTPLGCLNFDLHNSGPGMQALMSDDEAPTNNIADMHTHTFSRTSIRFSKMHSKLNHFYKKVSSKTIQLGPGDSCSYNVAIPSQMLTNNSHGMQVAGYDYQGLIDNLAMGVTWREFTRFLTVRAWGYSTIDSAKFDATEEIDWNNGASTFADVQLSVTKSSYIKYRTVPRYQRDAYVNSEDSQLNWTGLPIDDTQKLDTAVSTGQKIIRDGGLETTVIPV